MRALSEQWQFQRNIKRWSRRTKQKLPSFSANTSPTKISNNTFNYPPPITVAELSTSPTLSRTNRVIKTFSFCGEKLNNTRELTICVTPDIAVSDDEEKAAEFQIDQDRLTTTNLAPTTNDEESGGEEKELDRMGSFASGVLREFDASLLKLRHTSTKLSRSLPNVASDISSSELNINGLEDHNLSSFTGSACSSMGDIDKDDEEMFTGGSVPQSPLVLSKNIRGVIDTRGFSPDTREDVGSPASGTHWHVGLKTPRESNGSILEQSEIFGNYQRKNSLSPK